eukprot:g13360.t1
MEVTGRPSSEDVDAIKSPFAATMLESLPMSRPRPLSEMFPSASVEALDLLRLCLQFNPNKRITAKDALRHPYVVQFHNPDDEFDCDRTIRIPIDDNTKLTVQDCLWHHLLLLAKEARSGLQMFRLMWVDRCRGFTDLPAAGLIMGRSLLVVRQWLTRALLEFRSNTRLIMGRSLVVVRQWLMRALLEFTAPPTLGHELMHPDGRAHELNGLCVGLS